jgi:type VI protein secretion system component VasK
VTLQKARGLFSLDGPHDVNSDYEVLHQYFKGFDQSDYQKALNDFDHCSSRQSSLHDSRIAFQMLQAMAHHHKNCFSQFKQRVLAMVPAGHDLGVSLGIRSLLLQPFQIGKRRLMVGAERYIQSQWLREVYPFYLKHVAPFYPFNASGQDLGLAQFQAFFMPHTGVFDVFYQTYLSGFVRPGFAGIFSMPAKTFVSIQFAHAITQAFFSGSALRFSWGFSPLPHPAIESIYFRVGKRSVHYDNGPEHIFQWVWQGQPGACVGVTYAYSQVSRSLCRDGVWALFRLLDKAHMKSGVLSWPAFQALSVRNHLSRFSEQWPQFVRHDWFLPRDLFEID